MILILSGTISSHQEVRAAYQSCYAWVNHKNNLYWGVTRTSFWHTSLYVTLWKHKGKSDQRILETNSRRGYSEKELCTADYDILKAGLKASDLDAEGQYFCK